MSLGILCNPSPVIPKQWHRSCNSTPRSRIKSLSTRLPCGPTELQSSPVLPQFQELHTSASHNSFTKEVRELFHGLDGVYFVSAYDMAWVAMVPDASGTRPLFPSTIKWILDNQCPHGSWGESESGAIRMLCTTLACLVALQKWGTGGSGIRKGLEFVKTKLHLLKGELALESAMVLGKLFTEAQALNLAMDYDIDCVQSLFTRRQQFLESLRNQMVQEYPLSFVHILEALEGILWGNFLKYQSSDGLLFSVALTACAYVETGNESCRECLNNAVNVSTSSDWKRLVHNVRLIFWLEHFGIQRYFEKNIQQTLSHAFGIFKGAEAAASKLSGEDSELLFRFLRSHGLEASTDMLQDKSTCFELHLASEYLYPGEFISNPRSNEPIKHDDDDEKKFLMTFPWYSRMQRIEHIEFLTKYTTSKPAVLLEFGRIDFNRCQLIYQQELEQVGRWCKDCGFSSLNYARQKEVLCYFAPAATIFEPEFSSARIVWAKMGVLTTMTDDLFDHHGSLEQLRKFYSAVRDWDPSSVEGLPEELKLVFYGLYNTVNDLVDEAYGGQKRDISHHLRAQWNRLVYSELQEAEWRITSHCPGMGEYMSNGLTSFALEPIMLGTIFFMGAEVDDWMIEHPDCQNLYKRVSLIGRLLNDIQGFKRESSSGEYSWITIYMREHPEASIEDAVGQMREMIKRAVGEVLEDLLRPRELPKACKRVFDAMLRILLTFYRDGDGYSSEDLSHHVRNVLKSQL